MQHPRAHLDGGEPGCRLQGLGVIVFPLNPPRPPQTAILKLSPLSSFFESQRLSPSLSKETWGLSPSSQQPPGIGGDFPRQHQPPDLDCAGTQSTSSQEPHCSSSHFFSQLSGPPASSSLTSKRQGWRMGTRRAAVRAQCLHSSGHKSSPAL